MKKEFGRVFIANQKLTLEDAERLLREVRPMPSRGGQLFIANPDLPARFAKHATLNMPDPETFYAQGRQGYTDYPFLS